MRSLQKRPNKAKVLCRSIPYCSKSQLNGDFKAKNQCKPWFGIVENVNWNNLYNTCSWGTPWVRLFNKEYSIYHQYTSHRYRATATAPMTLKRQQSLEDTARLRALGGLNMPAAAGNLVLPAGPGNVQSPSAEEPASRSERVALQHIMILICIHAHTHTHTHTCMLALKAQLCVHVNGATDDILPLSHSPSLLACHSGNNTSY